MTGGRVAHGALSRRGPQAPLRLTELPAWQGWNTRSELSQAVRWIETYVRLPTGHRAGDRMKLARFQRQIMRATYDNRAAFISLPTGNAKTTLLAAMALERVCRGDDYAEVDVIATKQDQARILVETAMRMVESAPELVPLCSYHADDACLRYRPTGSRIIAHPDKLSAVQGLNFSLAIVDEFGFASDASVESLVARIGKRPDARIVGIGTPGFEPNLMFRMRDRARGGELPEFVTWLEWSARPGAHLMDRVEWRRANPALAAGFLDYDALAVQAALMDEMSFRVYHLGQWVESIGGWLPPGAWDACPYAPPPPEGSEVVLGVEGTYRRTSAIVGATLDGALFFGWAQEAATDDELRQVIAQAMEQWNVVEVVAAPRIRPRLFQELETEGVPVYRWKTADDVSAADELFRAITEKRVAHDHADVVGSQMARVVARHANDGTIRLGRPDAGTWCDAALAVRLAWWRASEIALTPPEFAPSIY